MKKQYFNPAHVKFVRVGKAEKYFSKRFGGEAAHFRTMAFEGDAPPVDPDPIKDRENLLKAIETRTAKQLEKIATKEELEAIRKSIPSEFAEMNLEGLRAMLDDKTGVTAKLAQQGLLITRMQAEIRAGVGGEKPMSVRQQIEKWHTENKESIDSIKAGEKRSLKPLTIRAAASPMLVSTVNSGGSTYIGRTEVEGGITDFQRLPKTFWDSVIKGRTSSPNYVWVNKTNPQGAAAFIGPGVAKPGISFELDANTSNAKKIADSAKSGTELLQDIDGIETFIMQELKEQVMLKINSTLMDSVGTSIVPTGIKQLSVTYTLTSISTVNPNYMDALRAVVAQMKSGTLSGDITIFINSIDSANMDLSKATDSGVYMLPPFVTSDGRTIAGARVIEDNRVSVGTFQAAMMKYYRVLIYQDYTVSQGWENDDFTKNLITWVGEMRIHQFFNEAYTGAFVNDTFDNVIAAITPAP